MFKLTLRKLLKNIKCKVNKNLTFKKSLKSSSKNQKNLTFCRHII